MRRAAGLFACLAVVSCGGDDGPMHLDVPPECNPLQGGACLAPWPVSSYQVADPASPTGVVLQVPAGAVPAGNGDTPFDPAHLNGRSGYSPATQIVAHFGVPLDGSNLAGPGAIDQSLTPSSPTVILDVTTGERVAHFAEVDANAVPTEPTRQALYLRPALRLAGGHRYLVAITRALTAADGAAIEVPAGFAALVSGSRTDNDRLEALRPSYVALFAQLAAAGLPADQLLLAWEFTTADDADLHRDLLGARDAAAAFQGPGGANLALHDVVVELAPRPGIARRVQFTFDAPAVRDDAGLTRGAQGQPEVRGTTRARGVALIPACATPAAPAPITIYGHGFFGGIEETGGAYVSNFAARTCRIIIGTDWRGMSNLDTAPALLALGNVDRVFTFGERIVQGMIDVEALAALAPTQLAATVLVDASGASVADATADLTFFGISQGSILGSTLIAIDQTMPRAVLHVGGGDWSLLFERSTNWQTLGLPLRGAYRDPLTQTLMQQIIQMGLDVIDPIHWAAATTAPGAGKDVLLYASVDDTQVTNLATFLQARTMGLALAAPAAAPPYGLTLAPAPPRSGLVIVDEDPTPKPPTTNALHSENNVAHDYPRRRARIMDQIGQFLTDGTIVDACGGVCACTTGACGPLISD
ncbi:MAG: hypothetical protein R3B06_00790 [Kofleriaceae bacterium]